MANRAIVEKQHYASRWWARKFWLHFYGTAWQIFYVAKLPTLFYVHFRVQECSKLNCKSPWKEVENGYIYCIFWWNWWWWCYYCFQWIFCFTNLYMSTEKWQSNFNKIRECRKSLKEQFGFHISEELHTKHLLSDKDPYRKYGWFPEQKQEIVKALTICISNLDAKIVNVIIDKTHFRNQNYHVLENALKYNIQRIENDSNGQWIIWLSLTRDDCLL